MTFTFQVGGAENSTVIPAFGCYCLRCHAQGDMDDLIRRKAKYVRLLRDGRSQIHEVDLPETTGCAKCGARRFVIRIDF